MIPAVQVIVELHYARVLCQRVGGGEEERAVVQPISRCCAGRCWGIAIVREHIWIWSGPPWADGLCAKHLSGATGIERHHLTRRNGLCRILRAILVLQCSSHERRRG